MGSFRTKEDDVAKISTSVFITNFPESCSAKELFQSCKQYGHVVDTFIPTKRSKNERRFEFVRFINVFNEERLVNNLCTSEVPPALVLNDECLLSKDLSKSLLGRVKQFVSLANLRKAVSNEGFVDIKIQYMGELWVLLEFGSEDSMKLFQDNVSIGSWFSQLKQATMEFTNEGRIAWVEVEGIPFKLWTDNTFKRIATKWGELLDIDDQEEMCFHSKRLCIYTKTEKNIFEEFKIIFRGKTSWIRAKETPGWVPDFMEENDDEEQSDVDSKEGEFKVHDTGIYGGDSDVEEARETLFEKSGKKENNLDEEHKDKQEKNSEDPFNIYKLLKKKKDTTENEINSEQTMKYPPGFTPKEGSEEIGMYAEESKSVNFVNLSDHKAEEANKDGHGNCVNKNSKEDVSSSVCSGHFKKSGVPRTGGSILNLMDELVKVGQVMGYKMDGCLAQKAKKDWVKELCVKNKVNFMALQETKMENMELFSVKMCWGNFAFDYVHSDSVGNSGGILCVWDPNSFRKRNATVNDYFVMIRGVWCLTGNDLLIIAVYAPHDCRDKQMLWDYLTYEIGKWKGEVVIMGDFNEVRYKSDRFGSVFNVQGANVFNSFITNAGLEEVPLGGSAFTWCHKSASKMSKLDRFLVSENLIYSCPNINAITLERYLSDHRPILLREASFDYGPTPFRYFHYWNEMEGFNKVVEDAWREGPCDKTNAMLNMMMKLKFLKAKIREWNKSNMLSVKNVKAKYKEELEALEAIIDRGDGNEEIVNKRTEVVNNIQKFDKIHSSEMAQKAKVKWSIEGDENTKGSLGICGTDTIPVARMDSLLVLMSILGSLFENDVYDAVKYFFTYGVIPKGCNSSFIALIPKILDANMVKDFRPISLIGSLYKIIAKILRSIVGFWKLLLIEVQSAFIARGKDHILDGPFILNEIVTMEKTKMKQSYYFVRLLVKDLILSKSNNFGGYVENTARVKGATSKLGCLILKTPFTYLGLKVGGSMSWVYAWNYGSGSFQQLVCLVHVVSLIPVLSEIWKWDWSARDIFRLSRLERFIDVILAFSDSLPTRFIVSRLSQIVRRDPRGGGMLLMLWSIHTKMVDPGGSSYIVDLRRIVAKWISAEWLVSSGFRGRIASALAVLLSSGLSAAVHQFPCAVLIVDLGKWIKHTVASSQVSVHRDDHGNCVNKNSKEDVSSSVCSGHFKKSGVPRTGGSILNLMDELVKVGQVMRYKMDGCMSNMTEIIESQGVKEVNFMALQETKMENMELFSVKMCWGNFAFDYVHSDSVGNSGGILCVWDPNLFCKRNATINDYFVMIRGVWCLTGNDLLIIAVYAPHDCRDKQMLWDYLTYEIGKWKREVVIMGDFNEVVVRLPGVINPRLR
ncbi:RNA-directed DNA polymerase, eukaryota [Tanacetum coccineum]|uniref:RNA-directed DNA polymerase, eukaryota n=1 Tax=Tanacetum coccineum TaxID=301880 RepID=A0ABQ4XE99_9ASTR